MRRRARATAAAARRRAREDLERGTASSRARKSGSPDYNYRSAPHKPISQRLVNSPSGASVTRFLKSQVVPPLPKHTRTHARTHTYHSAHGERPGRLLDPAHRERAKIADSLGRRAGGAAAPLAAPGGLAPHPDAGSRDCRPTCCRPDLHYGRVAVQRVGRRVRRDCGLSERPDRVD